MRARSQTRVVVLVLAALAAVLLLGSPALGQCSMCRAALAGSNNAFFIRNFNIGVLVLLLPPVTIFCSIFVVLKRYKTADQEELSEENCESTDSDKS